MGSQLQQRLSKIGQLARLLAAFFSSSQFHCFRSYLRRFGASTKRPPAQNSMMIIMETPKFWKLPYAPHESFNNVWDFETGSLRNERTREALAGSSWTPVPQPAVQSLGFRDFASSYGGMEKKTENDVEPTVVFKVWSLIVRAPPHPLALLLARRAAGKSHPKHDTCVVHTLRRAARRRHFKNRKQIL